MQLSREDIISWAVKKYNLESSPAPALISNLRKPDNIKWAQELEYLSKETVAHKLNAKSARPSEYVELEKKLIFWFTRLESGQAVVTDNLIREKALELAAGLKHTEFKASPNWLLLFKKRHSIQQYVLHGESGSAVGLSLLWAAFSPGAIAMVARGIKHS